MIILGVRERADGSWEATGLENEDQLWKKFWDTINNPNKVSINLLTDNDVKIYEISGGVIMVITVPRATREQKPVYINGDIFKGTFRTVRNLKQEKKWWIFWELNIERLSGTLISNLYWSRESSLWCIQISQGAKIRNFILWWKITFRIWI